MKIGRYIAAAPLAAVLVSISPPAEAWQAFTDGAAESLWGEGGAAVAVDTAGDAVVAGTLSQSGERPESAVVKYSGIDGSELWRRIINECVDTRTFGFHAVATTPAGDVVVGGEFQQLSGGCFDERKIIAKLSGSDGTELWRYAPSSSRRFKAVALDSTGDVFAAGSHFEVVRLRSTDGALLWIQTLSGHGASNGEAIAMDASGDIIVAGRLFQSGTSHTFIAAKFRGSDGALLWSYQQNPAGSNQQFNAAEALTLDSAGNAIAAGRINATDGIGEFAVVKLSGSTGAEMWRYTTRGTTAFVEPNHRALAVAVDAAGDVIAGGRVANVPDLPKVAVNNVLAVMKLSGGSGSELWRQEINGGGAGQDEANAVVVTAAGDAIVAGRLHSDDQDPFVVKFSGSDGTELWRRVVRDTGTGALGAVALDSAGNAILAGQSVAPLTGTDMFAWKLSPDGANLPCGDGVLDAGEACDDGNIANCDGCSDACAIEVGALCGDGLVSLLCGEECDDGGTADGDGCSSTCRDQAAAENVSTSATAGVPVTTDGESDGATPTDPVETSVTTPIDGEVSIDEAAGQSSQSGFAVLSQKVTVSAPVATAADPLVITFRVDSSRVPAGEDPTTIEIFKDGVSVTDCTGAPGTADPDPCISSRTLVGDDVGITARSSTASEWDPAVAKSARLPVAGRKLLIKDEDPVKRKMVVVMKDPSIGAIDLSCSGPKGGGAQLEVFALGGKSERLTLALPCANWKLLGRPGAVKGSRYKDRNQEQGPCKAAVVKQGRKKGTLKLICTGKNIASPLNYDLTAPGQSSVGMMFTAGPVTYCGAFVSPSFPPQDFDNEKIFKIAGALAKKSAPAPAGCWALE